MAVCMLTVSEASLCFLDFCEASEFCQNLTKALAYSSVCHPQSDGGGGQGRWGIEQLGKKGGIKLFPGLRWDLLGGFVLF